MTNRERRENHNGLVAAINRVREIVDEKNAETMSNDELVDACVDLAAQHDPTPPPSEWLETRMAELRRLTDGSAGAAFRNDKLHDAAHEVTCVFETEYGWGPDTGAAQ